MKAHPTAIIDSRAKIACSVTVGPYSVIGEGVELGEDCEVMSHVVLGGPTKMGKGNRQGWSTTPAFSLPWFSELG